jgi:hypothetical protein
MIAMIIKTATSLAFITACLATIATMPAGHAQMAGNTGGSEVVTNGPQTDPGDTSSSWSARQNVIQSERYDRLLETNRGFREARMRRECGPITDQELHQQCLASFQQDTPYTGSSSPRNSYRSGSGR